MIGIVGIGTGAVIIASPPPEDDPPFPPFPELPDVGVASWFAAIMDVKEWATTPESTAKGWAG